MSVPAERLARQDLFRYVDWLAEAFEQGPDELIEVERVEDGRKRLRLVFRIDHQLSRLERVVRHLHDPQHAAATELLDDLKRVRLRKTSRIGDGPYDLCFVEDAGRSNYPSEAVAEACAIFTIRPFDAPLRRLRLLFADAQKATA